jgi:hypothetical protein
MPRSPRSRKSAPPGKGGILHPLGHPHPVQVTLDSSGTPGSIAGIGARKKSRRVLQIRERWRIDDEWWRSPISRLYYQVILEGGQTLTLFRDLTNGRWYQQ